MSNNQAFRQEFRQHLAKRRYDGRWHLAFTVGFSGAIIIAVGLTLDAVQPLEWLTIPLTFVYANLSEYFGHRGPMHHPRRGLRLLYRRHAGQHHRFFTDQHMQLDGHQDYYAVLFPPLLVFFFLVAFSLPAYLLIQWLASDNVAALFVITAVAYFLNYELLHFAYHLPGDAWLARIPGVQWLRRSHWHHHKPQRMAHCNFNVTYPLGDWLMGTYERPTERPSQDV